MKSHESIEFRCPFCAKALAFPVYLEGKPAECPLCFETCVVPKPGSPVGGKLPIPLHLDRLVLRMVQRTDRASLLELLSDSETVRYLDWRPFDDAMLDDTLESSLKARLAQPGGYLWLVAETKESQSFVGLAILRLGRDDDWDQGAFGVVISPSWRCRGFGTEVARGLLRFSFREINLRRVAVTCDSRDSAGPRMLKKAGMREEGEFVEERWIKDCWVSTRWFALLQREWPN